ncbi:AMP-binding protein, partial [Patescibacteria group bacterium]|nr:AMP-binding protein [Patescibacteria group bacterium]
MIKKVYSERSSDDPSRAKLEKRGDLYYPAEEFRKKAWVNNDKIYKEAEKDPVKFWEKFAEELYWRKKWEKSFEHNPPYFKWFVDGKLNITESIFASLEKSEAPHRTCSGARDKIAIIWEPEPTEEKPRILTYGELFSATCKFANALKKLGVKQGDRVGMYLPMIPEVIISMLACARIGAVHTVVFSAFSSIALQTRLIDSEAKILITADG